MTGKGQWQSVVSLSAQGQRTARDGLSSSQIKDQNRIASKHN